MQNEAVHQEKQILEREIKALREHLKYQAYNSQVNRQNAAPLLRSPSR